MPAKAKKPNESKAKGWSAGRRPPPDQPLSDHQARYRQPPKAFRFKPGQSGNPSGRPKAAKRLFTELEAALSAPVTIKVGSRKRRVSKLQAMVKSLADRAASGDPLVLRLLAELRSCGVAAAAKRAGGAGGPHDDEADREVIAAMLQRIGRVA